MASWIVTTVVGGIMLLVAVNSKKFMAKMILYVLGGIAFLTGVIGGLQTPLGATIAGIAVAIVIAVIIWKAVKASKKKPDDGTNGGPQVHIHNHY